MIPRTTWRAWQNPAAPTRDRDEAHDVILQGFHWDSWQGNNDKKDRKSWYRILKENASRIREAGFSWVWFPPCSDSLSPQGYLPRRWNVMDTAYGSEDELRAAIAALAPVRTLADVVLNHRVGVATAGADFEDPPFPDNRAAIVCDDESGVGTGNPSTGERYPAARDLDHTNHDVQSAILRYLEKLRDLGFSGWRYDLVKGFSGHFVKRYNEATRPLFSVGEYFEINRQRVTDWIDSTGGQSAAFDFPTRYLLHDACLRDDYSALRSDKGGHSVPGGLIGFWPERAVTFVDNHDTEARRERDHVANYDNTRHFADATVNMAYAYVLTHPGVPCVYWSHFFDWGATTRDTIVRLMQIRRSLCKPRSSKVRIDRAEHGLYAAFLDDQVAMKLGARDWCPGNDWHLAASGERFAVWLRS